MFSPLLRILVQVILLLLTAWRESHVSRCDRVVPKGKYQRYCSERVCPERSEVKFVIPTLRRDLLEKCKVSNVGGSQATDGREEDSFPEIEGGGSIVVTIPGSSRIRIRH
ncbi:hypothetical protein Tco_0385139 [Tanacetum coccineum]